MKPSEILKPLHEACVAKLPSMLPPELIKYNEAWFGILDSHDARLAAMEAFVQAMASWHAVQTGDMQALDKEAAVAVAARAYLSSLPTPTEASKAEPWPRCPHCECDMTRDGDTFKCTIPWCDQPASPTPAASEASKTCVVCNRAPIVDSDGFRCSGCADSGSCPKVHTPAVVEKDPVEFTFDIDGVWAYHANKTYLCAESGATKHADTFVRSEGEEVITRSSAEQLRPWIKDHPILGWKPQASVKSGDGDGWPKWYKNTSQTFGIVVVRAESPTSGLYWNNNGKKGGGAIGHIISDAVAGHVGWERSDHAEAIRLIPAIAEKYPLPTPPASGEAVEKDGKSYTVGDVAALLVEVSQLKSKLAEKDKQAADRCSTAQQPSPPDADAREWAERFVFQNDATKLIVFRRYNESGVFEHANSLGSAGDNSLVEIRESVKQLLTRFAKHHAEKVERERDELREWKATQQQAIIKASLRLGDAGVHLGDGSLIGAINEVVKSHNSLRTKLAELEGKVAKLEDLLGRGVLKVHNWNIVAGRAGLNWNGEEWIKQVHEVTRKGPSNG